MTQPEKSLGATDLHCSPSSHGWIVARRWYWDENSVPILTLYYVYRSSLSRCYNLEPIVAVILMGKKCCYKYCAIISVQSIVWKHILRANNSMREDVIWETCLPLYQCMPITWAVHNFRFWQQRLFLPQIFNLKMHQSRSRCGNIHVFFRNC